jgi:hypothetical protein
MAAATRAGSPCYQIAVLSRSPGASCAPRIRDRERFFPIPKRHAKKFGIVALEAAPPTATAPENEARMWPGNSAPGAELAAISRSTVRPPPRSCTRASGRRSQRQTDDIGPAAGASAPICRLPPTPLELNAVLLQQRVNGTFLRPNRLRGRQAIPRGLALWRRRRLPTAAP